MTDQIISAVVEQENGLITQPGAISLSRYAQVMGIDECALWGVQDPTDYTTTGCNRIWSVDQRFMLARYLYEAQIEIENVVGYKLGMGWVTDDLVDFKSFYAPVRASFGYVRASGIKGLTEISSGEAVDHADDPAIVGPIATTQTSEASIRVYHPGTSVEIKPSKVTISGGFVTIEIPRCRLVKSDYADNPDDGWDYSDLTYLEATVDIKYIYVDGSTNAELVYPDGTALTCLGSCSEETKTACMTILNPTLGYFKIRRATYDSGSWTVTTCSDCVCPDKIRLNYLSGRDLNPQIEDTIIRLAHSKMPQVPCGCTVIEHLWKRDRFVPDLLSVERLNCPFGLSDGAWQAWRFAQSIKLYRGSVI